MINEKEAEKELSAKAYPILSQVFEKKHQGEVLHELIKFALFLAEKGDFHDFAWLRGGRQAHRYAVQTLATVVSGGEEERMVLRDISVCGLRAKVLPSFFRLIGKEGSGLTIVLKSLRGAKGERMSVEIPARVVRIHEEEGKDFPEVSFEFEPISEEQSLLLRKFIDVYTKE